MPAVFEALGVNVAPPGSPTAASEPMASPSGSAAVTVNESGAPSATVCDAGAVTAGARSTLLTVMLVLALPLRLLLDVNVRV